MADRKQKKRKGYVQYESAGAFSQTRLDQRLATISSVGLPIFPSGYGGGAYSPLPYVPVSSDGGGGGTGGAVTDYLLLEDVSNSTNAIVWTVMVSEGSVISKTSDNVISISSAGLYQLNYMVELHPQLAAYSMTAYMECDDGTSYFYTAYLRKQSSDTAPQKIFNLCVAAAHYFTGAGTITYGFDGGSSAFSEIAHASVIKLS